MIVELALTFRNRVALDIQLAHSSSNRICPASDFWFHAWNTCSDFQERKLEAAATLMFGLWSKSDIQMVQVRHSLARSYDLFVFLFDTAILCFMTLDIFEWMQVLTNRHVINSICRVRLAWRQSSAVRQ